MNASPETVLEPASPEWPSQTAKKLGAHLRGLVGQGHRGLPHDRRRAIASWCACRAARTRTRCSTCCCRCSAPRPIDFELVAVNLDQKQPDFPAEVLPNYLRDLGVPFHVIEQDTYSVVKRVIPEGKTMCGLCSRLRRGALYRYAAENGFTKIALGHHRDDIVETLFLNLFFGGRLKAMAPKLLSEDGRHIVIRPLAYVAESLIERYARAREFPIIPCKLCGSQDNAQRKEVKRMLAEWETAIPRPHRVDLLRAAQRRDRAPRRSPESSISQVSMPTTSPT